MEKRRLCRETFQKELKAFMKDLIRVFPNDRDMKMISSTLNLAMMDDTEDKVLNGFYHSLKIHEELIDKRDPQFFVETEKLTIAEETPLFSKLHSYWETLDSSNQQTVWDYIQVLFLLAKSYKSS